MELMDTDILYEIDFRVEETNRVGVWRAACFHLSVQKVKRFGCFHDISTDCFFFLP